MGAHPERSSLEKLVKYASRIEDGMLEAAAQRSHDCEGRTWGRFANRTSGPKPYHPHKEEDKPEAKDRVRANAITPQPRAGPSRQNEQRQYKQRRGRKVSRTKRDQLRAEGKCFQCEQPGHSQRDCPELNTMRPPVVRSNRVEIARLERLSKNRDRADLQVGSVVLQPGIAEDDSTLVMRLTYQRCASRWMPDGHWLNPESRWASLYGIDEYGTGQGRLIVLSWREHPEWGTLEFEVAWFRNVDFDPTDMIGLGANTDRLCVWEGGFRNRNTYDKWSWSALKWLRCLISDQLSHEGAPEGVSVEPSFDGYCLKMEGTDVYYEITHAEVLGDALDIRRILRVMHEVVSTRVEDRSRIFRNARPN